MRSALTGLALLAVCGIWLATPTETSAKSKGKSCASAEALFLSTGQGDRDGDGLSDCRERRQLGTSIDKPDSDEDGVSDGDEVAEHCDPLDSDSDDDGVGDGDDETPGIPEQEVQAFLDALTCPQVGVPGSITALGLTVTLADATEFEDVSCDEVAALFATGASVFVEIDVLEDAAGALTAAEVEVEVEHDQNDEDEDHDEDGED